MRIRSYGIKPDAGEIAKLGTPLSSGCNYLPNDFVAKLNDLKPVMKIVQVVRGGEF